MNLFDKKKSLSRRELKAALRKHSGKIPGTGGRKYYRRQREKIVRETFGLKYGSEISRHDYRRALRELQETKKMAKDKKTKVAIEQKIRYLRELGGKNI